jgi:hypothetical protein
MWGKFLSLNSKYIYLTVAVVVTAAVILKVPLTPTPSGPTKSLFNHIENLKAGDGVWFFLDTRPATEAIHKPQMQAFFHHCFSKDIKVIGFNPLVAEATGMGRSIIEEIAIQYDKKEYLDWVYMGFTPAGISVFSAMNRGIQEVYTADVTGKSFDEIPVAQEFRKYSDIGLAITFAGLKTPGYWVQYAQTRYNFPLASGVTGPMIPDQFPFLNADQMVGMMGDILGAAEYEGLLRKNGYGDQGFASASMFAQTVVHYSLIIVIVLANIASYMVNRKGRQDREDRAAARARLDSGME